MLLGPTYRVGMFEGPVLWVGPRDLDADAEAAGGEVAAWADIVAGEEMNARRCGRHHLGDAELAVGVVA